MTRLCDDFIARVCLSSASSGVGSLPSLWTVLLLLVGVIAVERTYHVYKKYCGFDTGRDTAGFSRVDSRQSTAHHARVQHDVCRCDEVSDERVKSDVPLHCVGVAWFVCRQRWTIKWTTKSSAIRGETWHHHAINCNKLSDGTAAPLTSLIDCVRGCRVNDRL
jgi:hypothetical protein